MYSLCHRLLFIQCNYLSSSIKIKIKRILIQKYYKHSAFNDSSKKGKQMMTNCSKTKAGNQDGFFNSEFQRVFEGEAYADRIRMNRIYRLENAKKNLQPGFRYSSPTKKPSGKGSNYGTFTEYDEKLKLEHFSSCPQDFVKSEPAKKNFLVNPAKKGTGYGYPNVTIGKQPPYFLQEEYDELKNTPREPKKPKPRSFEPYRAGIFQQGYFDPNPFRIDKLDGSEKPFKEQEDETEKKIAKPFLPSSPAKKDGGMKAGCLNSFPEYPSEPYPRIELVPRGVRQYINSQNQMFRPVPGVRPYPVKSIIDTNAKRKINSTNFANVKGIVYCNTSKK